MKRLTLLTLLALVLVLFCSVSSFAEEPVTGFVEKILQILRPRKKAPPPKKVLTHAPQKRAVTYRDPADKDTPGKSLKPVSGDADKEPDSITSLHLPTPLEGEANVFQRKQGDAVVQTAPDVQLEISQQKQQGRIYSQFSELPAAPRIVPAPMVVVHNDRIMLGKGWENFNAGHYDRAITFFTKAFTLNSKNNEATYGLACCYTATGDDDKAMPLFEAMVQKRIRLTDTLPQLLTLLLKREQYKKAAEYVILVDGKEREVWQKKIEQGVFLQEFKEVKDGGKLQHVSAFLIENNRYLRQCRMADSFNEIAAYFSENSQPEIASAIYSTLLACTADEGSRIGLYYSLKPLLPPRKLLSLTAQEKGSPEYIKELNKFKVNLLYRILETEPEKSEEIASNILRIDQGNRVALSALGWYYFNNKRYSESYTYFSLLNKWEPTQTNHATGLIYTLMEMKIYKKAMELAKIYDEDPKMAELEKEVRLRMLWNKVSSLGDDSPELEAAAQEILSITPGDEAIKAVLAWWHYNKEQYEKSYLLFLGLYTDQQLGKDYSYGLVSSLRKLKRYDEAIEFAIENKEHDERLAELETAIYLERARDAFQQKRYQEAELYYAKLLKAEPDDEESKSALESSRYRQTLLSKVLSPIIGLAGHTYGSAFHDLKGGTGTGVSGVLNQGIDWLKLPWNTTLRTYGEIWYRTRSKDYSYYDLLGYSLGAELDKSIFRLGAEYLSERYTTQDKHNAGPQLYLSWYKDWYKHMYNGGEDAGWFNIQSFSGSTYGKASYDLGGNTGATVSGSINQGIDWISLPKNILLRSFAEYRYNYRTGDNFYYNEHGPALGTELQRPPFKLGIDYYWEHDTERHLLNQRASVYLKWYFGWNLKPDK